MKVPHASNLTRAAVLTIALVPLAACTGSRTRVQSGANSPTLQQYDHDGDGRITCVEAKRHGITPVTLRHPAYQYMDDANRDGVVCESGSTPETIQPLPDMRALAEHGDPEFQPSSRFGRDSDDVIAGDVLYTNSVFREAADRGTAEAQFQLGLLYDTGRGVRQNPAEAIRWYRAAADQGHAAAQNNLGLLYDYGRGISQDAAEAMRWYRSAADQGFAVAQYNLGFMYANGRGLTQNYVDAYLWFNLASARASGDIREQAAHNRAVLAQHMTPQQIAQAEHLTGVWTPEP